MPLCEWMLKLATSVGQFGRNYCHFEVLITQPMLQVDIVPVHPQFHACCGESSFPACQFFT